MEEFQRLPGTVISGPSAVPTMVLHPDGADVSAQYTETAWNGSWPTLNDPAMVDSSGTVDGDPTNANTDPPTDPYGFQEVVGDGSYNPNLAADGTDLTNVPVTVNLATDCCYINRFEDHCRSVFVKNLKKTNHFTIVGEYHTNWRTSGDFTYGDDATSKAIAERRAIDLVVICDPGHWYDGKSLAGRMMAGTAPSWLEPVPLQDQRLGAFRLFRIRREG